MDNEDLSPVELETECIKPESVLSVHTQPNVTLKQNYDVAWKSSNGELDALVNDDISLCHSDVITGLADSDENLIEPDVSQIEAIPDSPEKQEDNDPQKGLLDETNAAKLLLQDIPFEAISMDASYIEMPSLPLVSPSKLESGDLTMREDDRAKFLLQDVVIHENDVTPYLTSPVAEAMVEEAFVEKPEFEDMNAPEETEIQLLAAAVDDIDGLKSDKEIPSNALQLENLRLALKAPTSVVTAPIAPDLKDLKEALEKCKSKGILAEAKSLCQSFFHEELNT